MLRVSLLRRLDERDRFAHPPLRHQGAGSKEHHRRRRRVTEALEDLEGTPGRAKLQHYGREPERLTVRVGLRREVRARP